MAKLTVDAFPFSECFFVFVLVISTFINYYKKSSANKINRRIVYKSHFYLWRARSTLFFFLSYLVKLIGRICYRATHLCPSMLLRYYNIKMSHAFHFFLPCLTITCFPSAHLYVCWNSVFTEDFLYPFNQFYLLEWSSIVRTALLTVVLIPLFFFFSLRNATYT